MSALHHPAYLHPQPTYIRTRFNRHRTRFVLLPPELDIHSENNTLINAALAAGLYPKILSIDPAHGHLSTITNSQAVTFHPSSVNFRRRPLEFGVNHLAFFTIMFVPMPQEYYLLIKFLQALKEALRLGDGPSGRHCPTFTMRRRQF
jgi:ATP-dependent RNA helicase DHX29